MTLHIYIENNEHITASILYQVLIVYIIMHDHTSFINATHTILYQTSFMMVLEILIHLLPV